MGIIATLFGGERRALEKTFVDNPAQWLVEMFGGRSSATGTIVNEASAMALPAFFSGVSAVAETMGSLSLKVYKRLSATSQEPDPNHPLYERLHLSPNPETTTMMWREMKQAHLMLGGNAYSEIVRDGGGRVTALWPIHPARIRMERRASGELFYLVRVPGATISTPGTTMQREKDVILARESVLHIRGISLDGISGLSRLSLHRESIGLSLDLQEYGARFFGSGGTPGGVLEHPGKLTPTAHQTLRESWERLHSGLTNAHRLAILEEGMKWHETSVENEKSQYLESRSFQVGEAARILRVPGIVVGHDDKSSTYASAEQFFLAYVVLTVRSWTVRWDQWLTLGLLTPAERRTHFVEHNLDSLLRGDALTRAQSNEVRWRNGTLNIDEWRAMENLNPLPNGAGQRYFVPLNMAPLDKLDEMLAKRLTPTPASPAAASPQNTPPEPRLLTHLLQDVATRAVRREVETIRKIAEREAKAPEAWRVAVEEFYARHAAYLAEALHCSLDVARCYTDEHRALVLAHGVAAVEAWDGDEASILVRLVRD